MLYYSMVGVLHSVCSSKLHAAFDLYFTSGATCRGMCFAVSQSHSYSFTTGLRFGKNGGYTGM